MKRLSRREFVAIAATGATAAAFDSDQHPVRAAGLSAQDVVERIKKNIGVEWKPDTVDTFKAGDPATAVTGIVIASMATLSVLRQAVSADANFIITCEPTFFSRGDTPTPPPARGAAPGSPVPPDPVFSAKDDFIKKNNLVIWRFSDHWRARKPDPFAEGLTDALGWSKFRAANDPVRVSRPATALEALASEIKKKLNAKGGIRVVGDPAMRVQTIGLIPGTSPIQTALDLLPSVDVVVAGEVREWESVEYARDKVTAGEKKALILLGRVLSEEHGMNACARWLKTITPELTSTWIAVGDPYWKPV